MVRRRQSDRLLLTKGHPIRADECPLSGGKADIDQRSGDVAF
jgi:hypothetical protein